MPFDGNGTYSPPPPPAFPAISGTVIYADDWNEVITDIADALSIALTRDGQAAMLADLDFGSFKAVNMADGVAADDGATVGQIADGFTLSNAVLDGATTTMEATTTNITSANINITVGVLTITQAELAFLDGVTSNLQQQLDAKGAINNQAWTGTHNFTAATITVPTAAPGTNTTVAASTAFVQQAAFNADLPLQSAATIGFFPQSDGSTAAWAPVTYSSQLNLHTGVI